MASSLPNTIKCNDVGSESISNKVAIVKALKHCDAHGTYNVKDVSDALKKQGLPDNLILGCQGHGSDRCGCGSGSFKHWSYWKIGDKKFTIFTYSNAVDNNNKNVVCNNKGNETASNREKILEALKICKAQNKYKCRDVANQLKSVGLKGCVVIGAQDTGLSGSFSTWSYWTIGNKKYTILSHN